MPVIAMQASILAGIQYQSRINMPDARCLEVQYRDVGSHWMDYLSPNYPKRIPMPFWKINNKIKPGAHILLHHQSRKGEKRDDH